MRTNYLFRGVAALLAAGSLMGTPLQAVTLSPGTSIGLFLEPGPVGASLVTTTNVSFNGVDFGNNILFSGSLVSSVWSGDTSNPYAGGLTFTYQISSDLSSANSIDRLTLTRFAGFLTDVGYNGTGTIPSRASRPTTDLIAFVFEDVNFLPILAPGNTSPILVIQTDSLVWDTGNASIIDGATVNVPVLVPVAPLIVPEPTTLALMALGAAALVARKRFQS